GGAVDGAETSLSVGVDRGQKRDAVGGILYIEIDAGNICPRRSVFMALKQVVAAVIKPRCWTAKVVIEHQIQVLIGLRARGFKFLHQSVIEQAESRDDARGILQRICTLGNPDQLEAGRDDVVGMS